MVMLDHVHVRDGILMIVDMRLMEEKCGVVDTYTSNLPLVNGSDKVIVVS